jgi:MFS transporter, OFA family, oxalate/formate antiporter
MRKRLAHIPFSPARCPVFYGWPVVLVVAGNGIATGVFGLLSAVTWAKYFGCRHLGAISGLNMCMIVLFSAVGPVLFSQSLSWTGTYRSAALVCLIATVVLLAASFRVRPPVRVCS